MNPLHRDAKTALGLMDLTSLNDDDTDARIEALCKQASTPAGSPAAVCVFPAFIATARRALAAEGLNDVQVATDSGRPVGFKAAGGIKTTEDAQAYLALAARIMGPDWVSPATFRFGASSLLTNLLKTLGEADSGSTEPGGY